MEKDVRDFDYIAGVPGKIRVCGFSEKTYFKNHKDILEEMETYKEDNSVIWRYRINYPANELTRRVYRDGIVVDFKYMPNDPEIKKKFTDVLKKVVHEPWFKGRVGKLRSDDIWIDHDAPPSRMHDNVVERYQNDLADIVNRLNFVREQFLRDYKRPPVDLRPNDNSETKKMKCLSKG